MNESVYIRLRKTISDKLNLSEIKALCFDLQIDFEQVYTGSKNDLIIEVLDYVRRRDKLNELLRHLKEERKDINIDHIDEDSSAVSIGYISDIISGILVWLRQVQNTDGGLPSDDEGSISCTWVSSGLLWASWCGGENFESFWMRKCLNWVIENINDDGGVPIVSKGDYSIVDATAQTIIAISLALKEEDNDVLRKTLNTCVNWLLYHHKKRAGWSWRASHEEGCWIASSAYAILALSFCKTIIGDKHLKDIEHVLQESIEWIKRIKNPDAGWGSKENSPSQVAITGLVCCVLKEVGTEIGYHDTIRYILNKQDNSTGFWEDTVDRPTGHTITRFGNPYCLKALLLCGSYEEERFNKGLKALLGYYHYPKFIYKNTSMATWPTRDGLLALSAIGAHIGILNCKKIII